MLLVSKKKGLCLVPRCWAKFRDTCPKKKKKKDADATSISQGSKEKVGQRYVEFQILNNYVDVFGDSQNTLFADLLHLFEELFIFPPLIFTFLNLK